MLYNNVPKMILSEANKLAWFTIATVRSILAVVPSSKF